MLNDLGLYLARGFARDRGGDGVIYKGALPEPEGEMGVYLARGFARD